MNYFSKLNIYISAKKINKIKKKIKLCIKNKVEILRAASMETQIVYKELWTRLCKSVVLQGSGWRDVPSVSWRKSFLDAVWFPSSFWGEDSVYDGDRVWGIGAKTWEHVFTGAKPGVRFLFVFLFLLPPPLALFFFLFFLSHLCYGNCLPQICSVFVINIVWCNF